MPRSLFGRLLVLSLAATLMALAVAGVAIGGVLGRFVTTTTDARLADRALALGTAIRSDGSIDPMLLARVAARIPRREPWRIDTPKGSTGTHRDDGYLALAFDDDPHWREAIRDRPAPPSRRDGPPGPLPAGMRPFDTPLTGGPKVHGVVSTIATDAGEATVTVAVPRGAVDRPIRDALIPLALSLLALGGALALAAIVQLRLGLRPLTRLRGDVAAIRAGRADQLPDDQPTELAPLTGELNALLADNAAALSTARASAANLAHGLKTPLATLTLTAGEPGRDPDGKLAALVARLDATVRHHLGRARAGIAGSNRVATPVDTVAREIAEALRRIHADSGVIVTAEVPAGLAVAVDRTDLEEMVGNLADNAMRWAATRVEVNAKTDDGKAVIEVTDDGPGIPPAAREQALAQGMRLDERGDGHGFGLAIVHDLATLYGGGLTLGQSPGGGLAATLSLPLARQS
ncbi:MAG TPA: ATP-binding protein [Sphingomonas sp.]